MTWYGLIDDATGDLVSVGTEAMFPGKDIANVPAGMTRHDFGADRPEFARKVWNAAQRRLDDRPAPVMRDRRDDLMAMFQADADFMVVWNALNATRKNQLRNGLRRVLAQFLGEQMMRRDDEPMEI